MVAVLCRMDHPCDPVYTQVPPPEITPGDWEHPFCSVVVCVEALNPTVLETIDHVGALGRGVFSWTPGRSSSAEQSWEGRGAVPQKLPRPRHPGCSGRKGSLSGNWCQPGVPLVCRRARGLRVGRHHLIALSSSEQRAWGAGGDLRHPCGCWQHLGEEASILLAPSCFPARWLLQRQG